jgi:microcin C transport system substrate-binding protein
LRITRRSLVRTGVLAGLSPLVPRFRLASISPAAAQEPQWRHALSLFGDVKYPAEFKHFDYVNAQAPKGGAARMSAIGTFDNFNIVIAGLRGSIAAGVSLTNDTLMARAEDEITTAYGLLAEKASYPPDFSSVVYRLRAEARWHDGNPVTVEDVIYSFEMLKNNDPRAAAYYRHVIKAEKTGEREVTFIFDGPNNRELPQICGELTILPKHWWEGTDGSGKKRDITATTLEPPLGSGPYRTKDFIAGRTIIYERVKDYWGKDLNVSTGINNFDEIRFDYFRDSTVELEAFKGDQIDFRLENSALNWATRYDFPARTEKRVVLEEFPVLSTGVMQAFVFNIRRDKFKDARVRRAFNFAFDFEEMNKQIFFGQYKRISSYFEGTELAWHEPKPAPPTGRELEILENVRSMVPPEVFTTTYTNPVGGNPEAVRANLREAISLMREAGYDIRNQKLVNGKSGEPLTVEFLTFQPAFERVFLFYKPGLERMGVTVSVRTVDTSQYENRLRNWDYDVIVNSWAESLSPGNEQRGFWGSAAADQIGSQNYVGIKNPAVDSLIDQVIFAKSRDDLVAATKALDRVLIWNHYVVPQWTYGKDRTARWDRFGRPELMPKYGSSAFPTVWWWDKEKAAKVGGRS